MLVFMVLGMGCWGFEMDFEETLEGLKKIYDFEVGGARESSTVWILFPESVQEGELQVEYIWIDN
jgi:hypothetical protein